MDVYRTFLNELNYVENLVQADDTAHGAVKLAGAMRLLLLDSKPLIDRANFGGIKIDYPIMHHDLREPIITHQWMTLDLLDPLCRDHTAFLDRKFPDGSPRHVKGPCSVIFHPLAAVYSNQACRSKRKRSVIRAAFLGEVIVRIDGVDFTVRDVIKFCANKKGAAHYEDDRLEARERLLNQLYNGPITRGGTPMLSYHLYPISRITLRTLAPLRIKLEEAVRDAEAGQKYL